MIHPGLRQEAERIPAGMIWLVGIASVTVTALLVAIAWWLVVPYDPQSMLALELGGLYWHLVALVWLFLWPLLYLIR